MRNYVSTCTEMERSSFWRLFVIDWIWLIVMATFVEASDLSVIAPGRGFWSWFGGVCSLTYCNGNFRVTMVSEPFNVIL